MRKGFWLLVFSCWLFAGGQNLWKDEILKQDKFLHFTISAGLTATGTEIAKDFKLKNPEVWGVAFSLALGGAKEFIYDTNPSPFDLQVDIVGALVGVPLNNCIQNWNKKQNKKITNKTAFRKEKNIHTQYTALGNAAK